MDNERIEKLERITNRLMRRAKKRIVGLITPYPISNAVFGEKVEGVVLRYMFPCEGRITKGMITLGTKPRKWSAINVKIFNEKKLDLKGFTIDKKSTVIEPSIEVLSGDCLEISLTSAPEDIVTEIWISFLWEPVMKEVAAKSFLISELENDLLGEEALTEGPALS